MKAMKVSYPVVAMIAEMMPTRGLYHMACKALNIKPQVHVENKRYTRVVTEDDIEFHVIDAIDPDWGEVNHSIGGPAFVNNGIEFFVVDQEYLGYRRIGETEVSRFERTFPNFEAAFAVRANVVPDLRPWKIYYDERKRHRELQEREDGRRKRYKPSE